MKRFVPHFLLLVGLMTQVYAGPYSPAAGQAGSTAIRAADGVVVSWATDVVAYSPGAEVDPMWMDTTQALGPAEGNSFDVVSLGQGGSITLSFGQPIPNRAGPDFAVFENAFSDGFLELAFVEVSSDGVRFVRFPVRSLTASGVGTYGTLDPTNVDGFAGTFRQGYGTPFDLSDLAATASFDPEAVIQVRLVDVVGSGSTRDEAGRQIFDPYPTMGSAGFDLDAIGVLGGLAPAIMDFVPAGAGFQVRFMSEPDVSYSLEFLQSFSNTWQLYAPPIDGTGGLRSIFVHPGQSFLGVRLRRELE